MRIWNSLGQANNEIAALNTGTALTIGNFDGVHRGHQAIIRRVAELAQKFGSLPVVVTFLNHTQELFGQAPPLINQPIIRQKLLAEYGLAAVLEVEFNHQFALLSPEAFFDDWLVKGLKATAIVVGHDFRFGAGGKGDYQLLRKLAKTAEIYSEQFPPVVEGGEVISSSRIRRLLLDGSLEAANRMLGYPFTLTGVVVEGEKRGRKLGFPTANIRIPPGILLPAYGVYLVRFTVEGETFYGVASVGVKPTFGAYAPLIEVFLLGADLDL